MASVAPGLQNVTLVNNDEYQTILIDGVAVDASISESHQFDSEVTDYPVETGSDVTDNVRIKPTIVTINGIVSSTPLPGTFNFEGEDASGNPIKVTAAKDMLDHLLTIQVNRLPISITTALLVYDDMVMQTLHIPKDAKIGRAFVFTATFKQVTLVSSDRTFVLVANPNAAGKTNLGAKAAPVADVAPYYTSFIPGGIATMLGINSKQALLDAVGLPNSGGD